MIIIISNRKLWDHVTLRKVVAKSEIVALTRDYPCNASSLIAIKPATATVTSIQLVVLTYCIRDMSRRQSVSNTL